MNITEFAPRIQRLRHRVRLFSRHLDIQRRCNAFDRASLNTIQRIYVINLDRQSGRWERIKRELNRLRTQNNDPLGTLARRFSAFDARFLDDEVDPEQVIPTYSLADQLTVEPNPLLEIDDTTRAQAITMTRQEKAIVLSHIGVWTDIANGDMKYTLVLEDDVYFSRGFGRKFTDAWTELTSADHPDLDILYVSYQIVNEAAAISLSKKPVERAPVGMWYASGYVLSKRGAQKLLKRLPVRGPVDLWLNLQFNQLNSFRTTEPLIEQRIDTPSTNSYSIMPVLTKLGVFNYDNPQVHPKFSLPEPVFAFGDAGTGLTSLARALSMVGYTCCSDIEKLPQREANAVLSGSDNRLFNAYVNIGGIEESALKRLYPNALFIYTSSHSSRSSMNDERSLLLNRDTKDKWEHLSKFLGIEYPSHRYPEVRDIGKRRVVAASVRPRNQLNNKDGDLSPWTIRSPDWDGIQIRSKGDDRAGSSQPICKNWTAPSRLDTDDWLLRSDTFPSNLALFRPENFSYEPDFAAMTLRKEQSPVRFYTSAAVACRDTYLYGRFSTELRPVSHDGVVTGVFLHRNGPRQEIDIEFLGNDTSKMLVNVYYNPGVHGTKLEYGYRGNPTSIDLGFDASEDFHRYEVEWAKSYIRWKVDDVIVHERVLWNPTPIPDLPMEFNVNIWNSRSTELAGKLDTDSLPVSSHVRLLEIRGESCNALADNQKHGSLPTRY